MKTNKLRQMVFAALIAAVYAAVTLALSPISYGNLQIRASEAMTLLPVLFAPAVPGITLGCFLANLFGAMMGLNVLGYLDCVIGTLATFLAAVLTKRFAHIQFKGICWVSVLMPVVFNALMIGLELAVALMPNALLEGFVIFGLEVAIGELIAVAGFGIPLIKALEASKIKDRFGL